MHPFSIGFRCTGRSLVLFLNLCLVVTPATLLGSTISSTQSGSWFDTGTWVGGVLPSSSDSVLVMNGHIVTVEQSGACAALSILPTDTETGVRLVSGGSLDITGDALVMSPTTASSGYLDGCDGILNIGGDVVLMGGSSAARIAKLLIADGQTTISGSIVMNNSQTRVTFVGGGTLSIGGDFWSLGLLTPATGTVAFNGTGMQLVGAYTYNNLTIDNSSGVVLDGNVTINGNLSLTNGKLTLGANSATMGPAGSISDASSLSYVVADGAGKLERAVDSVVPADFPVGTSGSYSPTSIQVAVGSDNFRVSVIDSISPTIGNDDQCVQRTWVISEDISGGNGDIALNLQWNQADEGSLFSHPSAVCWRYDGVSWALDGLLSAISGSDPYVAAVASVTSVGCFTIGNPGATVSVTENTAAPIGFQLKQNYPNPFNPSTTIQFSVDRAEHVTLTVFNLLGQEIATLFSGAAEPGKLYAVDFEAADLGTGLYMYTLKSQSRQETRRMVVLK